MGRLTIQEAMKKVANMQDDMDSSYRTALIHGAPKDPNYELEIEALGTVIAELQKYKDLEEAGRLIELPCAVGDTVYLIEEGCEDIYLPSTNYYYIEENPFDVWMLCGVGETVFLTKEEAEAKLKELEGDKE